MLKVEKLKKVPWNIHDEVLIFQKISRDEAVIKKYSVVRQEVDEVGRIKRRKFYPIEGEYEI